MAVQSTADVPSLFLEVETIDAAAEPDIEATQAICPGCGAVVEGHDNRYLCRMCGWMSAPGGLTAPAGVLAPDPSADLRAGVVPLASAPQAGIGADVGAGPPAADPLTAALPVEPDPLATIAPAQDPLATIAPAPDLLIGTAPPPAPLPPPDPTPALPDIAGLVAPDGLIPFLRTRFAHERDAAISGRLHGWQGQVADLNAKQALVDDCERGCAVAVDATQRLAQALHAGLAVGQPDLVELARLEGYAAALRHTVAQLALPYARDPAYRQEWRA
ncbi:hypothetical protein AB0M28_18450 [Streptomyces sp. NPDC051940]|uniref:hypothetical protein n=1 Tax=Streptomyces sp. NPDC051940 TaxID=3155675 RepID=UPI00341A81F8